MKTLLLPLCLISAGLVPARASDTPNEVLRAWDTTVAQSAAPLNVPLSLRAQGRLTPRHFGFEEADQASADALADSGQRVAPDAPWPTIEPAPATKDDPKFLGNATGARPPGAKRWRYNGQDYWIVPIDSAGAIGNRDR